jgi:hypothetical protein
METPYLRPRRPGASAPIATFRNCWEILSPKRFVELDRGLVPVQNVQTDL